MCACEPGYLCPRCAGTPDDPRHVELEERAAQVDVPTIEAES